MQYLLFCSTFILLFDEVNQQERFEYIPFIFRPSYTFDISEQFKNSLRLKTENILRLLRLSVKLSSLIKK